MGITTSETIVARRTKLLKMEGEGFDRPDIVKQLSKEFQVSERTIARDFQKRSEWQPQITGYSERKKAYYCILNRFDQIYKKASFIFLHGDNDNSKIGALKVMLDSLSRIKELANISNKNSEHETNSLTEEQHKEQQFIEWIEKNCTSEEKERYKQMLIENTELYIKFNNSITKGSDLH